MPIITIKSLPQKGPLDIPSTLECLGEKLSAALQIGAEKFIISWEHIPPDQLLFKGETTKFQEKSTHHPLVYMTLVEGMPEDVEEKLVSTTVEFLSGVLSIDFNNVCVIINTVPPGKLFVQGRYIMGSSFKKSDP